jgi:hypothetical protein
LPSIFAFFLLLLYEKTLTLFQFCLIIFTVYLFGLLLKNPGRGVAAPLYCRVKQTELVMRL